MSVLVEAISVIIKKSILESRFPGGWQGFLKIIPNRTFCSDGSLVRVGFMTPRDVDAYISVLKGKGLTFEKDGQAIDLAVVDQLEGPTVPAAWIEYGKKEQDGIMLDACWIAGERPGDVVCPDGWTHQGSLSRKFIYIPNKMKDDRVKFIRRDGCNDVYLDLRTGRELFVGRPDVGDETEESLSTRLEKICYEALNAEDTIEQARQNNDEAVELELFKKLTDDLLPKVRKVVKGNGRNMGFSFFTLGLILRILNRASEAEIALKKANELQPGVINTLRELVRCLGEQEKHQEALPFARKAVAVGQVDAGAWGNLAMCLIQCGEREEARRTLDNALDLDPDDQINKYINEHFDGYFQK